MREVNLIGGFYKSKSLPFSAQDLLNWLPVPAKVEGARSPIKLRGLPGLAQLDPPVVVIEALSITGDAPDTTVGDVYSYSYVAAGGTSPYTFSTVSGSLPVGLSLSSAGVITGTATTVQISMFTVRVTDSQGRFVELPDTINVAAVANGVQTFSGLSSGAVFDFRAPLPAGASVGDIVVFFAASEITGESVNFFPSLSPIGNVDGPYASANDGRFSAGWVTLDADAVANGLRFDLERNAGVPTIPAVCTYAGILIKGTYAASPFTIQSDESAINSASPPSLTPVFSSTTLIKAAFLIGGIARIPSTYPLDDGNTFAAGGDSSIAVCYQIAPFTSPVSYSAWGLGGASGTYRAISVIVEI